MSTVTEEKTCKVSPFGIRADAARNRDILLQCIPGCRLRSTIKANRPVIDSKSGESMIPNDSSVLGQLPEIPGMELHVNPSRCTYKIIDPLHGNKDLCEQISRRLGQRTGSRGPDIRGVPTQEGTLDIHRMKSLVRELIWIIDGGDAELIKGTMPKMDDDGELPMPGRFLLNPGARTSTTQPKFEDQWDAWLEQLVKSGG